MVALPCLAVGFLMKLVAVLFVLVALALILIVLIQKGRGGGLSGAFGGGGAGGVLGTKTGDFLTWVTIGLVSLFLILAVVMAKYYKPSTGRFGASTANSATNNGQDQGTQTSPNTPGASDMATTSTETNSADEETLPPVEPVPAADNNAADSQPPAASN